MDQLARASYPVTQVWIGISMLASYLTTYKRLSPSSMTFMPLLILEGEIWRLVTSLIDFQEFGMFSVISIYGKVISLGTFESTFYTPTAWFPPQKINRMSEEEFNKLDRELQINRTKDFIYYLCHACLDIWLTSFVCYYYFGLYLKNLSDVFEDVVLYRYYQTNPQVGLNFMIVFTIKPQYVILARIMFSWINTPLFYNIINYTLLGKFDISWKLFCQDPITLRAFLSLFLGHVLWFLMDFHLDFEHRGNVLEKKPRLKMLSKFNVTESVWTKLARYYVLPPWYWSYL